MHDRATTHDEFCSPDRNVISDHRVSACLGSNYLLTTYCVGRPVIYKLRALHWPYLADAHLIHLITIISYLTWWKMIVTVTCLQFLFAVLLFRGQSTRLTKKLIYKTTVCFYICLRIIWCNLLWFLYVQYFSYWCGCGDVAACAVMRLRGHAWRSPVAIYLAVLSAVLQSGFRDTVTEVL